MEYNTLTSTNLHQAALYADRYDLIRSVANDGVFIEIGVAFGDFSRFILDACQFTKIYLVDIFTLDRQEFLWGRHRDEVLSGQSHEQFVRNRFADEVKSGRVEIIKSDSYDFMASLPRNSADVIYIDGDHSYLGVLRDAQIAQKILKMEGHLVFNDYICYDHIASAELGVVPVVNDLCHNDGWKITGLALEKNMFCDVALKRLA